jgi:cell wall assembly regulator SMI1
MDYHNLSQQLRQDPAVQTGKGATQAEVAEAERSLGVWLSESYRRFLCEFGWASLYADELYGLGGDVPDHLDLVRATESERTQMRPRLRRQLVPLMSDGAGNHYCLDTSRLLSGRCPVIFWDHEHELAEDQQPLEQADDFVTWMAERLQHY